MHDTSTKYKQMHNKIISWNDNWIFIFICFVDILLNPSTSSSSSFMVASFLIQMTRRIRSSSRVEFFIFLIAWGIFFESLIFICSHLIFSSYDSSFFFFTKSAESNHFLLEHIPWMNEFHDLGRPFKVAITTSAFFTSSFPAWSCSSIWEILMTAWSLHSGSSHSSTGFLRSYSDVCSSLQIAWSRN